MSTIQEARSLDTLDLSWPASVKYYTDESKPAVNKEVRTSGIGSQSLVTTYNGVSRELLRKAKTLLLNEIRLLDLAPGTHGDPLAGSLRKVRLSDAIVYEPLSYTWNDYESFEASDNKTEYDACPAIFIENVGSFIRIGTNCEKALCSVRKATTERTIWVDSICVNQDDPEERSRQVDLMQRIFARAFTVLIYLGQESREHESSLALSLLGQPDRLRDVDGLDQNERIILKHLFDRPYFRRMWIVQEVALAQTLELHCGPASTYLSAFAEKPLGAILGAEIAHPPWLKHSKHAAISLPKPPTISQAVHLLRLIFDTASCQCKDDRDRIFALLSLLDSRDDKRLNADYTKTTVQVYIGIAAYIATNGLAWAVLLLSLRLALSGSSGLPSWVPNWKALGNAGIEDPKLMELMISNSRALGKQAVVGVATSGVITIRGRILGPITASRYGQDYMSEQRARMRQDRHRDEQSLLLSSTWDLGGPKQLHRNRSIWTLTKSTQLPGSWECHLEFVTRYEQSSNTQHIAFILHDHSTVLILRVDDDSRGHYILAEIGIPLVWGVVPEEWAWGDHQRCTKLDLVALDYGSFYSEPWLSGIESARLTRLWEYPELWSYNPATSAMSLTYRALEQAQSIDLTLLRLWLEWQMLARRGIQILRDESCLQLLIDEVDGLKQEEYTQIEASAGLDQSWSLGHFLSLFIKDPLNTETMIWPDPQIDGDQTTEGTATLPLLMQWAELTYHFLRQLQLMVNYQLPWLKPKPPRIEDPYSYALAVAFSHWSTAPVITNAHEACESGRASFLLRKILQQSSELPDPECEQERSTHNEMGRYWDWEKFEFAVEERLSVLRHVQPDIKHIQACFRDIPPDFRHAASHQVLAAHGVYLGRDHTEIRIA